MRAGRATSHSPPQCINRRNHTRPLHPKSTPAILLSPHCWGELAVLATQLQGDITCVCDCEARIVSLPLPTEKKISQTAQKHRDDEFFRCHQQKCPHATSEVLPSPNKDARLSPKTPRHALYYLQGGWGSDDDDDDPRGDDNVDDVRLCPPRPHNNKPFGQGEGGGEWLLWTRIFEGGSVTPPTRRRSGQPRQRRRRSGRGQGQRGGLPSPVAAWDRKQRRRRRWWKRRPSPAEWTLEPRQP
jgi:hypothetical protein